MVIQKNQQLIKLLTERINMFNLPLEQVCLEMQQDDLVMDVKRLKRFIKYGHLKPLPQVTFLWMLIRYGINITVSLSSVVDDPVGNRERARKFITANALE